MMGEFGHHAARGPGFCIDSWGSGPFAIEAEGKTFRFEDSDRFGPSLVNRDGAISARPWPPEGSPFWRARRIWVRQGRRVAEDGCSCVWDEPRPTFFRRAGHTCVYVDHGDEDGKYIELFDPPMAVTESPHVSPSRETKTSDIPVHRIGETE